MAENAVLNINPQLSVNGSGGVSSSPSLASSSTPSSSSSSLTVPGTTATLKQTDDAANLNANMLLNLTNQLSSGAGVANFGELSIATLLSTLQQQQQLAGVGGDSNGLTSEQSAAVLAAIIAQQQKLSNLPNSLALQQQQQAFNNVRGLIMPSQTSGQLQQQSQHQQNSNSLSPSLLLSQQQQQQQQNLTHTTNQETFIQPILGVAPLGKTPLTKEQSQQLSILDCAYKKLPHPSDTERIRNYLPRINVNTPPYYPMAPPVGHDSLDFLCKLSSDTLFFMFYYMEVSK